MELGQYQLQIFVSLVVVLGAALVALICDLLKGNNEQLRELAIELKVRREEEHKRFQLMLPHAALATQPQMHAAADTFRLIPTKDVEVKKPLQRAATKPVIAPPAPERRRSISPEALAAMAKGAERAGAPRRLRTESVPATPQFTLVRASSAAPKTAAARDWTSLLARPTSHDPSLPDSAPSAASESSLPSGFQDGFVLTRLVESRQPVSGLVVSIGASASDASPSSDVRSLIQSLIGPGDFAAQSGPAEFLLIFPGERGASAQRRLNLVAQQLWDFQLRSLGSFSVLFSWGGVEARSESIEEAIASATERMEETRRGRKLLSIAPRPDSEAPLARAV